MDQPIPLEWIKKYVDTLLAFAGKCPDGKMRDAALLRADHTMDLVKAWKEKDETSARGGCY